jgi:superfamily II DNA/RNA helicase
MMGRRQVNMNKQFQKEEVYDSIEDLLKQRKESEKSFYSLKLVGSLVRAAVDLGFKSPTSIQKKVIPKIIDGHNVCIPSLD